MVSIALNITTYGLGIAFWISFYNNYSWVRRVLYGLCSHLVFAVFVSFAINLVFPTYISSQFVFAIVTIVAIFLNLISRKYSFQRFSHRQYMNSIFFSVFFVFVFAFTINTIIQSRERLYLPIVGMNDDTATHMAMSVMTIKKESLLFNNSILEELIAKGINYQNARFYPPTIYTYTALLYDTFSYQRNPVNLYLLLNIYAVFSFLIYIIFLFSILDLSFSLVRSINIWSFAPVLVFVLFFVGGEYFMVLYRMSYLTQLLGNALVLMFITMLSRNHEGRVGGVGLAEGVRMGIFILGVGLTYYLFLPIAIACVLFWVVKNNSRSVVTPKEYFFYAQYVSVIKMNFLFFVFAALSLVPLVLYAISHSVFEQITIPGINLITLATLIQLCLMSLLFVYLKKYFVNSVYDLSIVGFLTSLILALVTTTPSMLKNGILPYYFYKSFFTSATFSAAFGTASIMIIVSQVNRHMHRLKTVWALLMCVILWVLTPLVFVYYLYAYNTLIPGYKGVTYLANGFFNYYKPHTTEKLISLYKRLHTKKPAVYNPGYWGENILLFALFENIPQIHIEGTRKEIFYFSQNPNYYLEDIVKAYKSGKDVYIFDGHNSFKPKR